MYEQDLPEPGITLSPAPAAAGDLGLGATGRDLTGVTGSAGKIALRRDGHVLLRQDHRSGWQEIIPEPLQTDQLQELILWLPGGVAEHRSTGRQARYTTKIMMAIYESLRIKNLVNMPLRTRENSLDMMVEDGTLPLVQEKAYDVRAPFPGQTWTRQLLFAWRRSSRGRGGETICTKKISDRRGPVRSKSPTARVAFPTRW